MAASSLLICDTEHTCLCLLLFNYNFTAKSESNGGEPQWLLCGVPHITGSKLLSQTDPFFPPMVLFAKVVSENECPAHPCDLEHGDLTSERENDPPRVTRHVSR